MATEDLRLRWKSTAENDTASEAIFHICKYGGVLTMDQTPFGRLESGLIDYRGYPASRILVKDVVAKDIDFSQADFSNCWLEANRFENCRFEKTDFTDSSDHGNTFTGCVFMGCKFKLASLGYKGSNFRNCHFEECGFQRANFIRAEFVGTDFVNCRLNGVDFYGSSFDNCKFEGVLDDVWFRGAFPTSGDVEDFGQPKINKMLNVSFEKAELHFPAFSNWCDLSTVKINNDGKHFKYDNRYARLEFLRKESETWSNQSEGKEAKRFAEVYLVHAPTQEWDILNIGDLESHYGGAKTARKIVDTLIAFG